MADTKSLLAGIALGTALGVGGVAGVDASAAKLDGTAHGVSFYVRPDGRCGGDLNVAVTASDPTVKGALKATETPVPFITSGPCDPVAIATAAGALAQNTAGLSSDLAFPLPMDPSAK